MLVVTAVHLHLLGKQKALLLLSLVIVVVDVQSTILGISGRRLSHHVSTAIIES